MAPRSMISVEQTDHPFRLWKFKHKWKQQKIYNHWVNYSETATAIGGSITDSLKLMSLGSPRVVACPLWHSPKSQSEYFFFSPCILSHLSSLLWVGYLLIYNWFCKSKDRGGGFPLPLLGWIKMISPAFNLEAQNTLKHLSSKAI